MLQGLINIFHLTYESEVYRKFANSFYFVGFYTQAKVLVFVIQSLCDSEIIFYKLTCEIDILPLNLRWAQTSGSSVSSLTLLQLLLVLNRF